MMVQLQARFGDLMDDFVIPPPCFELMQGEFLAWDVEAKTLSARFPNRPDYQNPYRAMQGGLITSAVDNTLGPLSILVAPPNVTRTLDMKYSYAVTQDVAMLEVVARLVEQKGPRLFFEADVLSPNGQRLARAKAVHWVMDGQA